MHYLLIIGLSNAADASTWTYPQYDGPVPILRSQGTPAERWESLKDQLFNTSGVEEGKNYAGQSIRNDWLEQFPDRRYWTCKVPIEGSGGRPCGAGFSRVDRAIVHIRGKHLEMRPYSCDNGGNCQMPNWLAPIFLPGYLRQTPMINSTCSFPALWLSPPRKTGQNIGTQRKLHALNGLSLLHALPWMPYL